MEYLSPRIGKSGAWYPDHHLKTKGTLWKFSRPPKGTPNRNYIKKQFSIYHHFLFSFEENKRAISNLI